MKFNQGEKLIYFASYNRPKLIVGLAELEVVRDTDSNFPAVILKKDYNPKMKITDDNVEVGTKISANQLSGVGIYGPDKYIFKSNKALFDRIFDEA